MLDLQTAAESTVQKAYAGEKPQFIEIIAIISIIVAIVGIIQRCEEADNVSKLAKSPSIKNRWLVRRVLRKHLTSEQYRTEGDKLAKGLFETGASATGDDVRALYKEIDQGYKPPV